MERAAADDLAGAVDRLAIETGFSGVVRVEHRGEVVVDVAHGMADRAHGLPNTVATRFGVASVAKGFTALMVMRLVEDGVLGLATRARELLGGDLPLIDDRVTIEQLLSHRSGIGDYLDEEVDQSVDEYLMPVPVHRLAETEDYLVALDGRPAKFEPGSRFGYCNSGYVVLALLAERAAGEPFRDLVDRHVCRPAGLERTGYLRSDELPGDAAVGYLSRDGRRTNVLHLPVRGSGDGGIFSTVADLHRFWASLRSGGIVGPTTLAAMTTAGTDVASDDGTHYGLGFWLAPGRSVRWLEGYDAGVSARSVDRDDGEVAHTVIANTSEGAWPITTMLDGLLGT